jgi:hypothetical protein
MNNSNSNCNSNLIQQNYSSNISIEFNEFFEFGPKTQRVNTLGLIEQNNDEFKMQNNNYLVDPSNISDKDANTNYV